MDYAYKMERSTTVKDDWYRIPVPFDNPVVAAMDEWCGEHKSAGKFFYMWTMGSTPQEWWYFELEKDALLFTLKWRT